MNNLLKRVVSSILIVQALMMPVFTITAIAASPFESTGSPVPTQPSAGATGYGSTPYQTTNYFPDASGNILMNVNVWGNVGRPGQVTIPEGADISTLISLAGGPTNEANMKKIRINRSFPDENGKMTYLIDLDRYAKTGDRSMLIALQPNDTIIIPKSKGIDFAMVIGIIATAASVYAITK